MKNNKLIATDRLVSDVTSVVSLIRNVCASRKCAVCPFCVDGHCVFKPAPENWDILDIRSCFGKEE